MFRIIHFFIVLIMMVEFMWGKTRDNSTNYDKESSLISFTENKGQICDYKNNSRSEILFNGSTKELSYFIRKNGISYQLGRVDTWKNRHFPKEPINKDKNWQSLEKQVPDQLTLYRLDINLINCNSNPMIKKEIQLPGYENFYLNNNTLGIREVKTYKEVTLQNIYQGIDLKWYQKRDKLKYDYLIKENTDYKQIKFEIIGALKIQVNEEGELVIITPLGNIIEEAPIVIQKEKKLRAKWLVDKNYISFEIYNIDTAAPLIIDPGIRVWGSYYGGSMNEYGFGCTVDSQGNSFFCGDSDGFNNNFVVASPGSFLTTSSSHCPFLTKFNNVGQRVWGTFYAGGFTSDSNGYGCCSDKNGNVYLVGMTNSTVNVATSSSHQPNLKGSCDAFLAKFDPNGLRLWGTYYGGSGYERAYSCATDATGNVYIAGDANSLSDVSTVNAQQVSFGGGNYDAFLAKFNSSGQRQWGTYYGGAGSEEGNGCATDLNGNVYLTGYTDTSSTNISTSGSHQPIPQGGESAFLVKFNTNGQRQWGTYYGGSNYTSGYSCAIDTKGNIYMVGLTSAFNSPGSISTLGCHQINYGGGVWDGFLVKFNTNGVRQWGTYYGDMGTDVARCCVTDKKDNVYICGYTDSSTGTIIATPGTQQNIYGGGGDGFISSFGPDGVRHWGTYYGGPGNDGAYYCVNDSLGNIFICGLSDYDSGNTLGTPGTQQTVFGGRQDAIFAKFDNCIIPSSTNPLPKLNFNISSDSLCSGQSATMSISGAHSYVWMPGSVTTSSIVFIANSNINYTITGLDLQGCENDFVANILVTPTPTLSVTPFFYLCKGRAVLKATGAQDYNWSPGNLTGSPISVSPSVTTQYTVMGANLNCTSYAVSMVSLGIAPPFLISSPNNSGCKGTCFTFSNNSAAFYPYSYNWGDGTDVATLLTDHCYTNSGSFIVTAWSTYTSGCYVASEDSIKILIFASPLPKIVINNGQPVDAHKPSTFQNYSTGAQLFNWSFGDSSAVMKVESLEGVTHVFSNPGKYCIKLVAIDTTYNCTDSISDCIDVLCRSEIKIPNVFTPNNDGVNETFSINTNCITYLQCVIFDRWGNEVYQWNGTEGNWDGKNHAGMQSSEGVFFYALKCIDLDGKEIRRAGNIELIR